jgi:hypothetical protein
VDSERQRASGYIPPPPTAPPPAGWQPSRLVNPAAPRLLPDQDHAAIDRAEESARALTAAVGIAATVVLIGLLIVLCGRLVF